MRPVVPGLCGVIAVLATFSSALNSSGYDQQGALGVFAPGERLEYKVKWLFFRLGTIVVTTEPTPANDKFRTTITLDSNPDLFFISIHNRYEAVVHRDPVRCESFRSFEVDGDDTLVTVYEFVDSLKTVRMLQRILPPDTVLRHELMDSVDRFFDGSSLFFFARSIVGQDTSVSVPTLVDFRMFATEITGSGDPVPISIDAVEYPVRARELAGRALFEGTTFGGFSGEFRGWFSDDHARIPLMAEMSITLGSVDVELIRWMRVGWRPPEAGRKR